VESHRAGLFNNAVLHSLRTIRAAKTRFHSLTLSSSKPAALVSQIELCDVLLNEIRAISCNFEKRMSGRSAITRRSVVARRNLGNMHLAVPRHKSINRSKRRK
jgi:hypothetical protein